MMKKVVILLLCIISIIAASVPCLSDEAGPAAIQPAYEYRAPSYFAFTLTPGMSLPIGKSSEIYKMGGGIQLSGEYLLPYEKPILFLTGGVGYNILPIKAETGLSLFSVQGGGGVGFDISRRLIAKAEALVGYYYAFLNDQTGPKGNNPFVHAGVGSHYYVTPKISLGLGLSYDNYFGLYNSFGISVGTSYHLQAKKERPLRTAPRLRLLGQKKIVEPELSSVEFKRIFPVFFKYYDDQSIGSGILKNLEKDSITDLSVKLFINQYMDNPQMCRAPAELKKGEESEIELKALFNEKVLTITEGTKVSAEVTIEYTLNNKRYQTVKVETLRIENRNAMTWEDDRRAAAFVTAKDPAVLKFSKNVTSYVKRVGTQAVDPNLKTALSLNEALSLYGISYAVDPTTPYVEYSKNRMALDYLQFPKQSLEYRAGDCDDLSILYCALLESVGVETAFITIPGHIYMAFALTIAPDEVRDSNLNENDLIVSGNKVWVPVEVTQREGGFFRAWQLGAKQWRENIERQQAVLYPVHEAWKVYEPVGLQGEGMQLVLPDQDAIVNAYIRELNGYIDREIYPQITKLQKNIEGSGGDIKYINRLGVLYARYGKLREAEREFSRALDKDGLYVPALLNMGNLYYMREDLQKALAFYETALRLEPDNPKIVLCIARTNHEVENYGTAKEMYARLRTLDPVLAQRFSYLDLRGEEALRAADAARIREVLLWEE